METPAFVQRHRREWLLVAIGLAAVLTVQLLGAAALAMGRSSFVAIPFGQAVIVAALCFGRRLGLPALRWGCWKKGVAVGVAAIVVSGLVSVGWEALLGLWGVTMPEQKALTHLRTASPAVFAFMTIVAGFWAPFVEEVYFRGWWLAVAKERMSCVWAVVLLAVIFALLHGEAIAIPGLFAAGIVFGVAALRWGVGAAVAAHAVFNCVTIFAVRGGWV